MEMLSTPLQFTGKDIAEYLAGSCPDRELHEYIARLRQSYEGNGLCVTTDGRKITGVGMGIPLEPNIFHISWLKVDGKAQLRIMLSEFRKRHAGRQLTGSRNGKFIVYNTEKTLRLLYGR